MLVVCVACADESIPHAPRGLSGEPKKCEIADAPETAFSTSTLITESVYWDCARPRAGDLPVALEVDGSNATVSGGAVPLSLDWSGTDDLANHSVVFWFGRTEGLRDSSSGGRGFYVWTPPDDANPISMDLRVAAGADQDDYRFYFALAEDAEGAPAVGTITSHDLHVIKVGSGDIQINLNWRRVVDLDLMVTDPNGDVIYFAAPRSRSGGELDLDSYPGCESRGDRGRGNENVFWREGTAPQGEYVVAVSLFSDCGTFSRDLMTDFTVTVIRDRDDFETMEDTFEPGDQAATSFGSLTFAPRVMTRFIY